ncbi:hypothetical protein NGR_b08360 (plasmid) [Sinorhizobium fredii NGR234]|uniref:Transmembrane protein n=1 Tax=Sinorhizobium fredii (strain NBRC 101917 / NGR234) TaxID=394 RepID=C3KQD4_SINFN|nr:hypothetical protein NGR_b08360 [Sinorhizobium fredii NGR234]
MIVASQTFRRCARELLAVLVAIMFLAAPTIAAAAAICDGHVAQFEHSETQQNSDHTGDKGLHPQKVCCVAACGWCSAVVPAPDLAVLHLASGGHLYPDPDQSIAGLDSPPAVGPPRSVI